MKQKGRQALSSGSSRALALGLLEGTPRGTGLRSKPCCRQLWTCHLLSPCSRLDTSHKIKELQFPHLEMGVILAGFSKLEKKMSWAVPRDNKCPMRSSFISQIQAQQETLMGLAPELRGGGGGVGASGEGVLVSELGGPLTFQQCLGNKWLGSLV